MLRKQFGAAIAAVAILVTGLVAAPPASAATTVLKFGSAVDVTTAWDPYAMSDGHFRPIMATAYESLLKVRRDYSGFDQGLATKWVWKDNKSLVLTLRKGVKFTDGEVFNAAVVKKNLDRVLVNKYAGPRTGALGNVGSVDVVNDSTVQINLKQPDSQLLLWLSLNMGYMVSPKAIDTADKTGNLAGLLTATAGTGPYLLDWAQSVKGSKYTFVRNPGYWQKGAALKKAFPFESIVYSVYTAATARANALRSGDVDIALVGLFDVPAVESAGFKMMPTALDVMALRLTDRNGENNKALGDLRVRQALNYAINRSLFAAFGVGTSQSFTKGLAAYNAAWDNYYKFDPAKAKSLLAAAGYGSGLTIKVAGIADPTFNAIQSIVQANLKDVGVTLNIVNEANIFAAAGKPEYSGFFFPYGAASVPSVVNDIFGPGKVRLNPLGQSSPALMALDDTYLAASKPADQAKAAQAVGKYVLENALEVPLLRMNSFFAYNPKAIKGVGYTVGNIAPSIFGILPK